MVRVNHTALDGKIAGNLCTLIDEEALAQARCTVLRSLPVLAGHAITI